MPTCVPSTETNSSTLESFRSALPRVDQTCPWQTQMAALRRRDSAPETGIARSRMQRIPSQEMNCHERRR